MNVHPIDLIPAFVLGALEPAEMIRVAGHLAACPSCRAEADTVHHMINALPAAAPPAHIKQRILARAAASRRPLQTAARWSVALACMALALALALGLGLLHARDQSTATQRALDLLRQQQQADRQMIEFITAPQTIARTLTSADGRMGAVMYMQTDQTYAVLIIRGMPPAAPGTTYQFWLANSSAQVAARAFDVDTSGDALLAIQAPAPLNTYTAGMVTLEHANGAARPSGPIMLSGSLARDTRNGAGAQLALVHVHAPRRHVDAIRRSAV